jgi:hypothetical protein
MKNLWRLSAISLVIALSQSLVYAQTGPGGVGNATGSDGQPQLRVWVSTDFGITKDGSDRVSSWADRSGNSADLTQATTSRQPLYSGNYISGYPGIIFDGGDDYIRYDVANFTSDYSVFLFTKIDSVNADQYSAILNNNYNPGTGGTSDSFQFDSDGSSPTEFTLFSNGGNRYSFGNITNDWTFLSAEKQGTSLNLYRDFSNVLSTTIGSGESNTFRDYIIGSNRNINTHLGAVVSEMFIYSSSLNEAQRALIRNYMASKYQLSLTNDYYAYEGIHDGAIAGIGRATASATQDSSFSGLLGIAKSSFAANGNYIMIGHDSAATSFTTAEAPNNDATYARRVTREWRVDISGSKAGSTDTVSVIVDMSGYSLPSGFTDFAVFTDADGNFKSNATAFAMSQVGATNFYRATGVVVEDGGFVTFGAIDREIQFSQNTSNGAENTISNPPFELKLTWPYPSHIGTDVTVSYSDAGSGTAGSSTVCDNNQAHDYIFTGGSATITAGNSTTSINPLTVCDDIGNEGDETVYIALSSPSNATLGTNGTHIYVINDDENPRKAQFAVPVNPVVEGNSGTTGSSVVVKVPFGETSGSDVDVSFQVSPSSTATEGTDFNLISTSPVTIAPGDTTVDLQFEVIGDTDFEGTEYIDLELTSVVNGTLNDTNTDVSIPINDDEAQPTISFLNTTTSVTEANTTIPFQFYLDKSVAIDVDVNFSVTAGSATENSDYSVLTSSPTTVVAGDTSGYVEISISDDVLQETTENFTISLDSSPDGIIGTNNQLEVLLDDDDSIGSNGPGGVGDTTNVNEIRLWLRADRHISTVTSGPDELVSSWGSIGDGSETMTQGTSANRPKLIAGGVNGRDYLEFDGTDDYLLESSVSGGSWTGDFTFFMVMATPNTNQAQYASIFNNYNNVGSGGTSDSFQFDADGAGNLRVQGSGYGAGAASTSFQFYSVVKSGTNLHVYVNGDEVAGSPYSVTSNEMNNFRDYVLGRNRNGNTYFTAYVPEVILYGQALSDSRRNIVENYLSSRYAISFVTGSNDKYAYETTHGEEIEGIGFDGTTYHLQANPNILSVLMDNTADWGSGDYMLLGNNPTDLSITNTDVPSGLSHRVNRSWRVDVTGTSHNVRFKVQLDQFNVAQPNDIVILVSSTNDFSNDTYTQPDPDVTASAGPVDENSGDHIMMFKGGTDSQGNWTSATPTTLSNGDYVTIATSSNNNTLPITMQQVRILAAKGKQKILGGPILQWSTATERENYGFEIERRFRSEYDSTDWKQVGFVKGAGTTTEKQSYTYQDTSAQKAGRYWYRIQQVDYDGNKIMYGPYIYQSEAPSELQLSKNYPNPFNPTTTFSYSLPAQSKVRLELYNALGQRVRTLVNQQQNPGVYNVRVDMNGLASGVYLYRLIYQGHQLTRKMLFLK